MYSHLFNQSVRIRMCLLTLLCGVFAGCVGVPSGPESVAVTRTQMQMGTLVKITAVARSESIAQAAASTAFAEIHRLEALLSTWISTSELSRVNASAGVRPIPVSPDTMTVVRGAIQVAEMTDGGFNITIGPAVSVWNVIEDRRVPTESELKISAHWLICTRLISTCRPRRFFLKKPGCKSM